MIDVINAAISIEVTDPRSQCSPVTVSEHVRTGKHGRSAELRGPEGIGGLLGCSTRTVRLRALQLGLSHPGVPVIRFSSNLILVEPPTNQHPTD